MPISGTKQPAEFQPLFFKSLKELDEWSPGRAPKRHDGIVKYVPRKPTASALNRGKLLVCHDYKGGYVESLFSRCYTFNFWASCDTFVYFSHQRVTVPPPGWISAAHRQGVKMLGTLIFEGGGEEDCLRLVVGKMPNSKTGQINQTVRTLPVTPYYAKLLAELARERGFDGYLLNFECPLVGAFEQTRSLAAWITLLQSEILDKVGPHGETVWYDSVVINGRLAWQDRLNSYNLPFFLSSTGLFSNYTWRPDYPSLTAQYFTSLDNTLIGNTPGSHSQHKPKTLQDVYMGVDVWGRGSHGGGGFGSYKAITHIAPESLGLSVALFGQAWSWESEQDKPGWTWNKWWEYDSKLWVGPVAGSAPVHVPEAPRRPGQPECPHGEFLPVVSFFPIHPPPDPADLPFHTTFCPGTGLSWFVNGVSVYQSKTGWTDIDKQTTVGDLIWPSPKVFWEDDREDKKPTALSTFCMDDAWNGGNSIQLSISFPSSTDELAAYRPIWIPLQSLSITARRQYEASAIYKTKGALSDAVETEFALAFKPLSGSQETDCICNIISTSSTELTGGWTKLTIQFDTTTKDGIAIPPSHLAIGLVVAVLAEDPTRPFKLNFLLGQLNTSAYVPASFNEEDTIALWADYSASTPSKGPPTPLSGTLSWEIATFFPPVTAMSITSPEDAVSAWNRQPTITWFPSFLYFNIYAQLFTDDYNVAPVETARWIGTSGWDGQQCGFDVRPDNLPFAVPPGRKVRFYVRGVTDRGEVMSWGKCAYLDLTG